MVMVTGQHSSAPLNRERINARGLLPHTPAVDGNYIDNRDIADQPRGVYVHAPSITERPSDCGEAYGWPADARIDCDAWRVNYCGPLMHDPLINGAVVLLEAVPREWIELEREARS